MLDLPKQFVIFDLEWTAWEGSLERQWSGPGEYREICEVGAVQVMGDQFEVTNTFRQLVTLELVAELPPYTTKLTGITAADVRDKGMPYHEALKNFATFCGNDQLYCWGKDGEIIAENCRLKHVPNPFEANRFNNMREFFKEHGIPADNYYSSTIVEAFGKKNTHTAHQGLDDALNIAEALRYLSNKASFRS